MYQIASANKVMIPAMSAVKFPALEVSFSDGRIVPIPTSSTESPKASLICISFRANSQVQDVIIELKKSVLRAWIIWILIFFINIDVY